MLYLPTGSSEAMQLLCVAALVLSAVAAQPGSRRPWQDGKFPPAVADSKVTGKRLTGPEELPCHLYHLVFVIKIPISFSVGMVSSQ